jgi:P27 family predicted phage terminase small subunit
MPCLNGEAKMPKGQQPKPALIKRLEGNRRKVARAAIGTDPAGLGQPRLPATLGGEAARLWADVVRSLPVGLLSAADNAALEAFAREWQTYREADAMIQKTGLLIQSPQGPLRNPLLSVRNNACRNMTALGSVLGLSPAARARLSAPGHAEDDPMELLLGMEGDPAGAWSTVKTRQ